MIAKLLSGVLFNILNVIVQVFVGLFVFRALLSHMGEADFGLWAIMISLISQITFFEFGLGMMISRHVSKADELDKERQSVVTNAVLILCIGATAFSILSIFGWLMWDTLHPGIDFKSGGSLTVVLTLLVFSYALNFIAGSLQGYLSAKFCFKILNGIKVTANVGRLLLILLAIKIGMGIEGIALAFFITALFDLLAKFIGALSAGINNDLNYQFISLTAIKKLMRSGVMFLPLKVNDYIRNNSTILVTGLFSGPSSAVPMRLSGRLMEIYVELTVTLNFVLTPYFSKLAGDENSDFTKNFRISLLCSTALSCFILINILAIGEWFLQLWLGIVPEFTWDVLKLLAIGYTISNSQGPVSSMLVAKGFYKQMSLLCISESLITLILMCLLTYSYGVVGAAVSLLLSLSIVRGLLQPILVCRLLKLSIFQYIMPIGVSIVAIGSIGVLAYILSGYLPISQALTPFAFILLEMILIVALGLVLNSKRSIYEEKFNHRRL